MVRKNYSKNQKIEDKVYWWVRVITTTGIAIVGVAMLIVICFLLLSINLRFIAVLSILVVFLIILVGRINLLRIMHFFTLN